MLVNLIKQFLRILRMGKFFVAKILYSIRQNRFGKGSYVSSNVQLRKCNIGAYTTIGPNSVLNRAIVGAYCSFASDVMIGGEEHAYWDISSSDKLTNQGISETDTIIGYDVWIGAQCYIRQGVRIGNGVVIGSNSFVNRDIPDYAIVAGTPARIMKYRFDKEMIEKINQTHYWEFDPPKAKVIIQQLKNCINN
ncbi:CatB-related O-acetyltransferase [Bacteroides reticulotermitis]|uniref:Acetyltransferase-like isoleucine patch superfamily enzyme n=1 Tax=Bacteroides reticulotermitis TaxID=1133319 RepID=A0A840D1M3_9BACE|nr:CatB-related O-acetyltransferase [Bacteroides reticulotermitis]MBB4045516.1 acetyltransferase-like isoleucine patch superfamily enzyme [Bacteroides reticulotermitis]